MWIVLDILIIAVLCLAVILITPHLSGWNKLASDYCAQGPPSGERFLVEFAKIGDIYFWHSITLYRSPDGIYLSAGLRRRLCSYRGANFEIRARSDYSSSPCTSLKWVRLQLARSNSLPRLCSALPSRLTPM